MAQVVLIRHGETQWSLSGQHTGRTDIPLTENGRRQAVQAGRRLHGRPFALVLTSPLQRALETCRLSGYGADAELSDDLMEWDYGDYEGRRTADIRREVPGWSLFSHGVPHGETAEQVSERLDRVIGRLRAVDGDSIVFAHGHILRCLGARWLGMAVGFARHLTLSTGTLSVLGYERETPAVLRWNDEVDTLSADDESTG